MPHRRTASAARRTATALLPLLAAVAGCEHSTAPGFFFVNLTGKANAQDAIVLGDGRILVTGSVSAPIDRVLLARFHPSGVIDTTFGVGGTSTTAGTIATQATGSDADASVGLALAAAADGKIVVAGRSWTSGHAPKFLVLRYDAEGMLDPTFAAGGILTLDPNPNFALPSESASQANTLAIQRDGKIVVAGSVAVGHSAAGPSYWSDFGLIRIDPRDGSLDRSFGQNGIVITSFGNSAFIHRLLLLEDGRMIAGGYAAPGGGYDVALARYLPDGQLDRTFGHNGTALLDTGGDERMFDMAAVADGSVVLAGQWAAEHEGKSTSFLLARIDAAGMPARNFGAGKGFVVVDFPAGASAARAVTVQGSRFLAVGYNRGPTGDFDFAFARVDGSGVLDGCAGDGGRFTFGLGSGLDDTADAVVLEADRTPVLAGRSGDRLFVAPFPHQNCLNTTSVQ